MLPEIWSATDRIFCHFGPFFCPFTPLTTQKIKIKKNEKTCLRYYPFTCVHHKRRSYDVWFLRYGEQQTEFFVILGHFFPFYLTNNPKNQTFEKLKKKKKCLEISPFYTSVYTKNHDHML